MERVNQFSKVGRPMPRSKSGLPGRLNSRPKLRLLALEEKELSQVRDAAAFSEKEAERCKKERETVPTAKHSNI